MVSLGRLLLGAIGAVVGLYGAWLLLSRQDLDQLLNAALWLASGVVLHDLVLAPLVLVLVVVGARLLTEPVRIPAVVGFVVLGTATIAAIPVLGRFGARPDNPTLLDRDYLAGWLLLAGLTLLGILIATLVRSRRR
jgi:hypothetical protein